MSLEATPDWPAGNYGTEYPTRSSEQDALTNEAWKDTGLDRPRRCPRSHPAPVRPLFHSLGGWLLLVGILTIPATGSVFEVRFMGGDRAHLLYDFQPPGDVDGTILDYAFIQRLPTGQETVLTNGLVVSGNIRVTGLQPGETHTLTLRRTYRLYSGEVRTDTVEAYSLAVSAEVSGAPLFPEVLDGQAGTPASLTLKDLTIGSQGALQLRNLNLTAVAAYTRVVVGENAALSLDNVSLTGEEFAMLGLWPASGASIVVKDSRLELRTECKGPARETRLTATRLRQPLTIGGLGGSPEQIVVSDSVAEAAVRLEGGELSVENSLFFLDLRVWATRSYALRGCEIYGLLAPVVTTADGVVENCRLDNALRLVFVSSAGNIPSPRIRESMLLGGVQAAQIVGGIESLAQNGVSVAPPAGFRLHAANNYWGGPDGPITPGDTGPESRIGWLDRRGVALPEWVDAGSFLTVPVVRPCTLPDARPMPFLKVRAHAAGQNAFGRNSVMRCGRPALLCFDVMAGAAALPGVRYWLNWEGRTNLPANPGFVASIEPWATGDDGTRPETRTLNFLVETNDIPCPTIDNPWATVGWTLWADTSAVTGYATPGSRSDIAAGTCEFNFGPWRPLRVAVVPLQTTQQGQQIKPNISKHVQQLHKDLSGMWPLREEQIQVTSLPPVSYGDDWSTWAMSTTQLGTHYGITWAFQGALRMLNAQAGSEGYDFLMVVVTDTWLDGFWGQGVEGVSTAGARDIALVGQESPWAVSHELAHGLGLYRGKEQYGHWFNGYDEHGNYLEKNKGARLELLTAFNPETRWARHFPVNASETWWDFMGAAKPIWICVSSLAQVARALQIRSALPPPSSRAALAAPRGLAAAPAGTRRVLLTGLLRPQSVEVGGGPFPYREIVPASVVSRDITELLASPIGGSARLYARLRFLDDAGSDLAEPLPCFADETPPNDPLPAESLWIQSFDLPSATRSLRLEQWPPVPGAPRTVIWTMADRGEVTTRLIGPAPGTTLGETLVLQVAPELRGVALAGASDPAPRLIHQLLHRAAPDRPWTPLGLPTSRDQIEIPTDVLPASDDLAIKLVTSDGLRSASAVLSGLRLPNRPPRVEILWPHSGQFAAPGTAWTLEAFASDAEEGILSGGVWTSSLDGELGRLPVLDGIRLSAGTHTLRFTARDPQGLESSAQVVVAVSARGEIDLGLSPDALDVRPLASDPAWGPSGHIRIGQTNVLTVSCRNGGVTQAARLRLFATTPGEAETLLAERVLQWGPFDAASVSAELAATRRGEFRIRALLEPVGVVDPQLSNNERTWVFANAAPVAADSSLVVVTRQSVALTLAVADPDGDPLQFTLVRPPTRGTLSGTYPHLTYTSSDSVGTDEIAFTVSDGLHTTRPATLRIQVLPTPGATQDGPVSVTIRGPVSGPTGSLVFFTNDVVLGTFETPLTHDWTATDQLLPTRRQTAAGERSSIAAFLWDTSGVKTVSVVVSNLYGTVAAEHRVTLTNAPGVDFIGLSLSPVDPTIPFGSQPSVAFTATGFTQAMELRDVTALASWESSNPAVATFDAPGLATLRSVGTTTIQARYASVSAQSRLTVTAPPGTFRLTLGSDLTLRIEGELGKTYLIETTTNLARPWEMAGIAILFQPGQAVLQVAPEGATRFYRASRFD